MQALNIRVKHDQQPWVNEEGNQKKDCEGSAYLLKPMQLLLHSKRTFYQGLLKSSQSALAEKEGLMYVQWKGLNQARDTIKQGNCKITIKFCHCHRMIYDRINKTEKEKQRTERRRISWTGARLKDVDAETKGEKGRIFCKISDLILLISQLWQNQIVPHLPSFCHVIVISFPSVSKDPGTFQLSLIWQMSNNFAFNLHPAGAKYARQQIVVSEMVDCRWFWN